MEDSTSRLTAVTKNHLTSFTNELWRTMTHITLGKTNFQYVTLFSFPTYPIQGDCKWYGETRGNIPVFPTHWSLLWVGNQLFLLHNWYPVMSITPRFYLLAFLYRFFPLPHLLPLNMILQSLSLHLLCKHSVLFVW